MPHSNPFPKPSASGVLSCGWEIGKVILDHYSGVEPTEDTLKTISGIKFEDWMGYVDELIALGYMVRELTEDEYGHGIVYRPATPVEIVRQKKSCGVGNVDEA